MDFTREEMDALNTLMQDPDQASAVFNRYGKIRDEVSKYGAGSVSIPAVDDRLLNAVIQKINYLGGQQSLGLFIGMGASQYGEVLVAKPRTIDDLLSLKSGSGTRAEYSRMQVKDVPEGTIILDPREGRYFMKRIADGNTLKDPITGEERSARGPYYQSREGAKNQDPKDLLHYWEAVEYKGGTMVQTGKMTRTDLYNHLEKFGHDEEVEMTDKEGNVIRYTQDDPEVRADPNKLGKAKTEIKKMASNGGMTIAEGHTGGMGSDTGSSGKFPIGPRGVKAYKSEGGKIVEEDLLFLGGLPVFPDEQYKPVNIYKKEKIGKMRWLSGSGKDPENKMQPNNHWTPEKREEMVQFLKNSWDIIFGANTEDNYNASEEQIEKWKEAVARVWNDEKNKPNSLKYYGYAASNFSNEISVVNTEGKLVNAPELRDRMMKELGDKFQGIDMRVYDPETGRPIFEHQSSVITDSDNYNQPLLGKWDEYLVSKEEYRFVDEVYGRDGRTKSFNEAQEHSDREIGRVYGGYERGDRNPARIYRLSKAVGLNAFSVAGKLVAKNIAGYAGSLLGVTAAATGIALAATAAWPVAAAVGVASMLPAHALGRYAVRKTNDSRDDLLSKYEKSMGLPIAKAFNIQTSKIGVWGSFKQNWGFFKYGLRVKLYDKMGDDTRFVDTVSNLGGAGMGVGATLLAASAAGGLAALGVFSAPALAASAAATAIGGAIVGAAGVATKVAASMADKGYYHTFSNYFTKVHKSPRRYNFLDKKTTDILNRMTENNLERGSEGMIEFKKQTVKLDRQYFSELNVDPDVRFRSQTDLIQKVKKKVFSEDKGKKGIDDVLSEMSFEDKQKVFERHFGKNSDKKETSVGIGS